MLLFKVSLLLIAVILTSVNCFVQPFAARSKNSGITHHASSSALQMGLLDKISKAFLKEKEGDFIRLNESGDSGLGPAILLYNVPAGILNEELLDMLDDGAPQASKAGVILQRLDTNHPLLDLSLEEALKKVMEDQQHGKSSSNTPSISHIAPVIRGNPVLLFSGFPNAEMMASYKIIAAEIYAENGSEAACAKAVPNALSKLLRQVVEEISGDHQDALKMNEPNE